MTKTTNYNLNQWAAEDPVRRTDFNEDNAKIDAALAGKAEAAVVEALQTKVDTVSVQKCEIVTGTYAGDGTSLRSINLGRKPKAVLLFSHWGAAYHNYFYYGGLALPGEDVRYSSDQPALTVTDTGFTVYSSRISTVSAVSTNSSGFTFHYIAFF